MILTSVLKKNCLFFEGTKPL